MHGNLLKPWPSCTQKRKVYGTIRVPFLTYSSTCWDSRATWWWQHLLSSDGGQTVTFSEPQFPWMKLGKSYLFSRSGACVSHRQGLKGAPHLLFLERALQVVSRHCPYQSVLQDSYGNSDVAISSVRTLSVFLVYKTSAPRLVQKSCQKCTLQAAPVIAKN